MLKSLAFIMALNILFSSAGFAMFEHTCHSLGITSHGFSEKQFCEMESAAVDSPTNELSFKQNDCCETHSDFQNLKTESGPSIEKAQTSFVVIHLDLTGNSFTYHKLLISEVKIVLPPTNAPPDSGRFILIKKQSYLI